MGQTGSVRMLGSLMVVVLAGTVAGCSSSGSTPSAAATSAPPSEVSTSASPEPTPYPCKAPGYPNVIFAHAVKGSAVRVQRVRVLCGVPDDIAYEPKGPTRTQALSPDVQIRLLVFTKLKKVTVRQLASLLKNKSADSHFYYTGVFGIRTNAAGQITSMDELYHP